MYSTAGLNSHASAVYGGIPAPTNVTFQVYLSFVITENSSESSTVDGWSKKSSMHASLPDVVLRDARQVLSQSWKTSLPVDTPITQTQYYSDLAGGGEMKFL